MSEDDFAIRPLARSPQRGAVTTGRAALIGLACSLWLTLGIGAAEASANPTPHGYDGVSSGFNPLPRGKRHYYEHSDVQLVAEKLELWLRDEHYHVRAVYELHNHGPAQSVETAFPFKAHGRNFAATAEGKQLHTRLDRRLPPLYGSALAIAALGWILAA